MGDRIGSRAIESGDSLRSVVHRSDQSIADSL